MDEVKIVERLTETESRSKSNQHRLDAMEMKLDDLTTLTASVEKLALSQSHMDNDLKEIKADVKTLTEKPAKRWDGIVDKIVWAVAAALLTFVFSQIGLQ